MNPAILKMITNMIGPAEVAGMVDGLTQQLIDYTKEFALLEGEEEIILVFFEQNGKMVMTVAAIDDQNRIVRQIETMFVKDWFIQKLKK